MKLSVITPTSDREALLQGTYQLLKNQHYTDWEWLIYDTSLRPAVFQDPRITYVYDTEIVTIGEKRNRLIDRAKGECIVHFDDDDYYAPTYLDTVMGYLKRASFFTLHSWFSYDTKTGQFFYWDTETVGDVRYHISAVTGMTLKEIELGPHMEGEKAKLNEKGKKGYGFSYAYRKEVAIACRFPDIDLGEDRHFYEEAELAGFLTKSVADQKGEAIHVIHTSNTSVEFPQYRIPPFLAEALFPQFLAYIKVYHEKN